METIYLVKKTWLNYCSCLEGMLEQTDHVSKLKLQQYAKLLGRELVQEEKRKFPIIKTSSLPESDNISEPASSFRKSTSFREEAKLMVKSDLYLNGNQ